jgi:hypothetical protein
MKRDCIATSYYLYEQERVGGVSSDRDTEGELRRKLWEVCDAYDVSV